jgi:phosphatidylserine/phosphatidylglycerophosphate/cardiolipin synthase-like enzyme
MKVAVAGFLFLFSLTTLAQADTKVYFSPNGGCQDAVIQEIKKAQKTIDIAMYDLTNKEISRELIIAKTRGVWLRIFLDQGEGNSRYSKGRYMMGKGIDVRFYQGTGLMHNKFAVIDDKVLITGSFNWTAAAERENQDNLLVITDENLVRKYAQRFDILWAGPQDNPVKDDTIKVRVSGDVTVSAIHRSRF